MAASPDAVAAVALVLLASGVVSGSGAGVEDSGGGGQAGHRGWVDARADCVWHCKLNERGMPRRSFVPPESVRDLRALTRATTTRHHTPAIPLFSR